MRSKKKHPPGPIPPDNRPRTEPPNAVDEAEQTTESKDNTGAPFQEQDVKRRLGDFGGAGEHPRQQPGPLNDGERHDK